MKNKIDKNIKNAEAIYSSLKFNKRDFRIRKSRNWKIFLLKEIILIVLVLISFFSIYQTSEYIGFHDYELNTVKNDIKKIRQFSWFYDFSSSKGEINFSINSDEILNQDTAYVGLEIPGSFKNKSSELKILISTNNGSVEFNNFELIYTGATENHTKLFLFLKGLNYSEIYNFRINYKSKIFPSGRFQIYDDAVLGGTSNIEFNLGLDYLCYKSCIEQIHFIKIKSGSTDKELKFELIRNESNEANTNFFIITSIRDIRILQGLLLGLLSSTIFTLIFVGLQFFLNENDF